jgi:hypothetical protein
MLSNDTSRPAFSAISHEYHSQILNRKTFLIYRMAHQERSAFWEDIASVILSQKTVYVHVSYSRTVSKIELFHCTDEQHAMSSHELQSAVMLTVAFSKVYYTRETVPSLSLGQQIPLLETVCNISFLSTVLELYSEITLSRKPFGIGCMYIYT